MREHLDDRELVMSWDGVPSQQPSSLERHLDTCEACRDRSDRLRETLARVSELSSADYDAPSSSFIAARSRLEAALCEAAGAAPSGWWRIDAPGQWPLIRGLGVGVAVVGACALALITMTPAVRPASPTLAASSLPDSSLTPGAVSAVTADELCNGVRPSRLVSESVRRDVLRAYGMDGVPAANYELDALITPELGGSTDPANLWPQRYHSPVWNARVKDELEELLPRLVCSNQLTLAQAQREIAADWIAAYKKHFNSESPLRAHLTSSPEDESELVIVSDHRAPAQVARSGW